MSYITIVGTKNYFGSEVFSVGQVLRAIKDPENVYDQEAIKVSSDANVIYGYIANSVRSVAKGCKSAGRIYDTFKQEIDIKVLFIVYDCVIAEILYKEASPNN